MRNKLRLILSRSSLPALRLLAVTLMTLGALTALGPTVSAQGASAVAERFVGDYELLSFLQFPEGGTQRDMNYIGRLSYDRLGNMAGQGMPRDLPEQTAPTEQVRAGFAYWGTVSFEPELERVIHHVEGSPMAPQWVGQDNVRYYELNGDLLRLSLRDESGRTTATLTWRRLR